jgi:tetratricopeptide (TPR) repeat protein
MQRGPWESATHTAWRRYAGWLPLLVAVAAYAPAPRNDFVWDDVVVVGQQLPALQSIVDAFRPPADLEQWSPSYYRPLVVLSYMADRALGGGSVIAHVSNVAFHVLATLAVFLLLARLLRNVGSALQPPLRDAGCTMSAVAGACLFAAHPLHTESVSWMCGRSDVLATLFLVPAVTLALRWRDFGRWPALVACSLAVLCALLAKEVAAAAFVIVPAALLLVPAVAPLPAARRTWGGIALALAIPLVLYAGLRTWGGADALAAAPAPASPDPMLALRVFAWLLVKTLWPWPQLHFVPASALPGTAGALLACAVLAALATWAALRWRLRRDGLALFAVAWFLAATAPVVAAAMLGVAAAPVAERYLYLPSVALAIAFAAAIGALATRGRGAIAAALATGVTIALAVLTFERGLVWQHEEALWADAVAKAPGEAMPLAELARARQVRGDETGALALWLRARELPAEPQVAGTIEGNIGLAYLRRGDEGTARPHLERALRLHPAQYSVQRALGAVLYAQAAAIAPARESAAQMQAMLESARSHYESALRLAPTSIQVRLELALVLARLGDLAGAFGTAESPVPLYAEALRQLEWVFAREPAAARVPATRMLAGSLRSALARRGAAD